MRMALAIVAFVLLVDAVQSWLVIEAYQPKFGTLLWFTIVLKAVSSALGVVFVGLTLRGWAWSLWVWAGVLTLVGLFGVLIGLRLSFLFRWDVALPWIILAICRIYRMPFGKPWQRAA